MLTSKLSTKMFLNTCSNHNISDCSIDKKNEISLVRLCDDLKNILVMGDEIKKVILGILGILKSESPAIQALNLHYTGWFNNSRELSCERSYLIGVCYYIDTDTNSSSIEQNKLQAWVNQIEKEQNNTRNTIINLTHISKLSLDIEGNILFNQNIILLNIKSLAAKIKRSKQPGYIIADHFPKFARETKIYNNLDGVCSALSMYFILYMNFFNNTPSSFTYDKNTIKKYFFSTFTDPQEGDKVKNLEYYPELKETLDSINSFAKFSSVADNIFSQIGDIGVSYSRNLKTLTLSHGILMAIFSMLQNRLTQLYVLIFSDTHVMAFVITKELAMIKVRLYDPNSNHSYFSFKIKHSNLKFSPSDFKDFTTFNQKYANEINEIDKVIFEQQQIGFLGECFHIEKLPLNLKIFASKAELNPKIVLKQLPKTFFNIFNQQVIEHYNHYSNLQEDYKRYTRVDLFSNPTDYCLNAGILHNHKELRHKYSSKASKLYINLARTGLSNSEYIKLLKMVKKDCNFAVGYIIE